MLTEAYIAKSIHSTLGGYGLYNWALHKSVYWLLFAWELKVNWESFHPHIKNPQWVCSQIVYNALKCVPEKFMSTEHVTLLFCSITQNYSFAYPGYIAWPSKGTQVSKLHRRNKISERNQYGVVCYQAKPSLTDTNTRQQWVTRSEHVTVEICEEKKFLVQVKKKSYFQLNIWRELILEYSSTYRTEGWTSNWCQNNAKRKKKKAM